MVLQLMFDSIFIVSNVVRIQCCYPVSLCYLCCLLYVCVISVYCCLFSLLNAIKQMCHGMVQIKQNTDRAPGDVHVIYLIWGFDYNFTNYNFRETLDLLKYVLPEGSNSIALLKINVWFDIIVGEVVAKSPYKYYAMSHVVSSPLPM